MKKDEIVLKVGDKWKNVNDERTREIIRFEKRNSDECIIMVCLDCISQKKTPIKITDFKNQIGFKCWEKL